MLIISLSYKKRVGKDTFFGIAKSHLSSQYNVQRIAFADALKNEIYDTFLNSCNIERSDLDDAELKLLLRPLMQSWGTVRRELCGKDYWVNRALVGLEDKPNNIYIITDCRYFNELQYINEFDNSVSINIVRDTGMQDDHISETELDVHTHEFDYTIDNNGTLEEYETAVKSLLDEILKKSTLTA